MLASVFTPTHDATWLLDTYRSLLAQKYSDWEWVLVPNGSVQVPSEISADARVRICPAPPGIKPGVGALKRFACSQCRGDLFVELDHDDLLVPQSLELLVQAATEHQAGFLYSDFVNFLPDGSSRTYGSDYGWETY